MRQLFRIIDWLIDLPAELHECFRQELHEFEKEGRMPYVTSIERLAREEGREEGRREGREEARIEHLAIIEEIVKERFGADGSPLMTKLREMKQLPRLRTLILEIVRGESLEAARISLEAAREE